MTLGKLFAHMRRFHQAFQFGTNSTTVEVGTVTTDQLKVTEIYRRVCVLEWTDTAISCGFNGISKKATWKLVAKRFIGSYENFLNVAFLFMCHNCFLCQTVDTLISRTSHVRPRAKHIHAELDTGTVASPDMGHWGTCLPLDFQQFHF